VNWKTMEADGCVWQISSHSNPDTGLERGKEVLEFRPQEGVLPPRRLVVDAGALERMGEPELRAAYLKALPIGGDHYGRPGKRMTDAR
jgi:hypothetical protein